MNNLELSIDELESQNATQLPARELMDTIILFFNFPGSSPTNVVALGNFFNAPFSFPLFLN